MGAVHDKVMEFLKDNRDGFRGRIIPMKDYDMLMNKLCGCSRGFARDVLAEMKEGGYPVHVTKRGVRLVEEPPCR